MLPDELAALTLGHAAPDPEFNAVVQRVRKALGDDGALATDQSRSILRRTADEEFVGISGSTEGFRNPSETTFRWRHS